MKGLPTELIYGLVIAAILLFEYLMRRFKQQAPQEPQDTAQGEEFAQIPDEELAVPAAPSVSSMDFGHFSRAEAPGASASPPGRRFSRRALMGNPREMQNAVVIAAILGRCRAFEPHDIR